MNKIATVLAWGVFWFASNGAVQAQTFIAPDHPDLVYSEYVNATVTSARASFDRSTITGIGNFHSPGTRVNFRCDALEVQVRLDYQAMPQVAGGGLARLEVDGVLQPVEVGSDTQIGPAWFLAHQQTVPVARELSLVLPYGVSVDFLGLRLFGGTPALLGPPAPRPQPRLVTYGDSITHGYRASSVTAGYPYQVGTALGWSVVNLGYFGQGVTGADGGPVGAVGGDRVFVAIGTNGWYYDTAAGSYHKEYGDFLDGLRAVQPDVPVFAITPPWFVNEALPNGAGLILEDYRQLIRSVVLSRTTADPNLYLIEGYTLFPADGAYLSDGVHPNDLGFQYYARALSAANLIVEGGFEDGGFAWQDQGNTATDPDAAEGMQGLRIGPGLGGGFQHLGRLLRGERYRLVAQGKVLGAGSSGRVGVSFHDPAGVELSRQEITVASLAYRRVGLSFQAPAAFASARLFYANDSAASVVLLDALELVELRPLKLR